MKKIFTLSILLITSQLLFAQELPVFLKERIDFCNSNFTEDKAIQLRKELNELENYFVRKGLLADKSGISYYAVYERIAKENDLNFEIDTTFELLETLEFQEYTTCFYKVLTSEQLSQLNSKHLEAAEKIAEDNDSNITPGIVAQKIINNLDASDFDLEFYKVSSLLAFYRIASPMTSLNFGLPEFGKTTASNIQTIKVELDKDSKLKIDNNTLTMDEARQRIHEFLLIEPNLKGIELTTFRNTPYKSYLEVIEMFNSVYSDLNKNMGNVSKNIIINDPK
ncbi:hypothetical protein J2X69_002853 [Algoriphagus sp. 4150]|uniref:hypothetical protein n=1 Tax=Algoriphagus sp. 4150 TaxID=2817756 RepID=UPI00285B0069|nr:hypothetical protein [Algoriphagus sp. 4150]MDR7130497.1 hypothetical protein [Algoriphagus sp. 4150]